MSWRPCDSYCEHGGVCELKDGHDGLHSSGYCKWDDAHALTKEAADAKLIADNPYAGPVIVAMEGLARAALEASHDD